MSRIGNRVLTIVDGVDVSLTPGLIHFKNSKSEEIFINFNKFLVDVQVKGKEIKTVNKNSSKESKSQYGTINALINNSLKGLSEGFVKIMEISGVGYKASLVGSQLRLDLGYSHPVLLNIPAEVKVELTSSVEIKLSSFNKEILGQFASIIRTQRKVDPYKAKGIKYKGEIIARKVGKTSDGKK